MIISKLTLYNFGVYAGVNTFEFHHEKPVVLIGGMNGRGKTTFLDAVLLALYGQNSFAFNESKYKSYGQYLKSFVNKADGSYQTYVELEFKLDSETNESYVVKRQWTSKTQRVREKISVYRNGESNQFLTDNWPMFVENILPSGLSNFFFFDGEKIAELALDSTNTQMKESIKNLLGISVLDILENDIGRIISRIVKRFGSIHDSQEMDSLKEQKERADVALQIHDDHIAELYSKLEQTQKALEKANAYYTMHGGDIVEQRQDLYNQRAYLSAEIDQKQEQLLNLSGGELPLALVEHLIRRISKQAEREHESKALNYAIVKIRALLDQYSMGGAGTSQENESIKKFVSFVENQAEAEAAPSVYDLSDQTRFQIRRLLSNGLLDTKTKARQTVQARKSSETQAEQIDSYLSVDIDEKRLAKAYKKIKTLEQEYIQITAEIDVEKKKRVAVHGEALRAASEYRKFVESLLSNLELNDDGDRLIKYAHQATDILREYRVQLQKQKIGVLATTMTQCYKKLANKKNLIERVEMDDETLDFIYLDYNGETVPNRSLSAGERQLMVISLLWALAICSKKELPVIIDTPLSRMDSNHRVSLINTYFPQASKQTIILSTDSEIDQRYYEIMKKNVGDEFTLVYDDANKCSSIQRGYFIGDTNGSQTN